MQVKPQERILQGSGSLGPVTGSAGTEQCKVGFGCFVGGLDGRCG